MHPTVFALIGTLGLPELLIILAIIVLIFGANRLSGLGKGMGQAIRGFKDEMKPKDEPEQAKPPRDA
ncbi:MAG: twin-arginine translocase TatA/TatE family subunit [Acidobacteria bacterium]|jgi:sec-independent protein translocase protein TatA|nr:twin-arginine translocase TatA/TatE family subunit [Acidobacteriota bacterium]